jgi:anti-sigma28 factor (negative regulator of flagellin synthesis)
MGKEDWQKEELIMNLKDVLNELFVDEIEKSAIEVIKKAIEEGSLSEDVLKYITKG